MFLKKLIRFLLKPLFKKIIKDCQKDIDDLVLSIYESHCLIEKINKEIYKCNLHGWSDLCKKFMINKIEAKKILNKRINFYKTWPLNYYCVKKTRWQIQNERYDNWFNQIQKEIENA